MIVFTAHHVKDHNNLLHMLSLCISYMLRDSRFTPSEECRKDNEHSHKYVSSVTCELLFYISL